MNDRGFSSADLDRYITGNYGEDQFPPFCEDCGKARGNCECEEEEDLHRPLNGCGDYFDFVEEEDET